MAFFAQNYFTQRKPIFFANRVSANSEVNSKTALLWFVKIIKPIPDSRGGVKTLGTHPIRPLGNLAVNLISKKNNLDKNIEFCQQIKYYCLSKSKFYVLAVLP